ncbi:MAG: response regulator, partial [Candidatus Limiplasma sp.]|nr:response regulator [Candidatus Limiplasma sp.]
MYKMILADDNALSIKGLEANLDFAAMGVELAGSFLSGMDVLAYLTQHPDVDLLVSDIRMPHMTGLELAREALSRNKMIKIVLISAYDDFEYAQEALRIGVTDYVQKPIQYDELTATLRRALKKLEEERAVLRRLEAAQPELRKKFYQDLIRIHPMLVAQTLAQEAQYLGIATEGGSFLSVAVAAEENEDRLTLPDAE